MKKKLIPILFLCLAQVGMVYAQRTFVDFDVNLCTDHGTTSPFPTGVTILGGSFHDGTHGYYELELSVPVDGPVKFTFGGCQHSNKNVTIKEGNNTLATLDSKSVGCSGSVTYTYNSLTPTTLTVFCGQYCPYVKAEACDLVATTYTITYANANGATGILPAAATEKAIDDVITLPKNFTMYKEGYTMTGWTDGVNTYAPGANYTVTGNATLTAVYTQNVVSLAGRTAPVTIKWQFSQGIGVPVINVQGSSTFVVTQVTLAGKTLDVKLAIDATIGKFVNRGDNWTQVNPGVVFTIPSAKGAVITYKQYDNGPVTTPEIDVTSTDATYALTATGTSGQLYYEYIQVVLPATVILGENGWSTFAGNTEYTVSGATVYKAAYVSAGNYVALTEVTPGTVMPAEEGVILKGTEGDEVTISTSATPAVISDFDDNQLLGAVVEQIIGNVSGYYVLATFNGVTAFNPCQNVTIPGGKAFLPIDPVPVTSAPDAIRIEFNENDATDIKCVEGSETAVKFIENGRLLILKDGVVYDALGRAVK